ncbi:hypothetical protein ACJMK2_020830 [Sinanodonta woodiana]|uniref:P2X purinoreceptor 7 intracellular domain-containing protein n=1 Tax=Sinanodonta woodiana TaxID=1069815 RepID=A0ABD3U087_SINWO
MASETDIKPYQFEPLWHDTPIVSIDDDDDENSMLSQSSSDNQDIRDRNGKRTTHISTDILICITYRQFMSWIWHHPGKGNRRILPSCAVCKIRDTYPDPLSNYVGF